MFEDFCVVISTLTVSVVEQPHELLRERRLRQVAHEPLEHGGHVVAARAPQRRLHHVALLVPLALDQLA